MLMRIVIVYPPLPDVGFHFLPQLDQLWLTDLFDALLVFPTIVHIAFHRKAVHGMSIIENVYHWAHFTYSGTFMVLDVYTMQCGANRYCGHHFLSRPTCRM